uniref:Putative vesicle transport v-SNARE protein n=1 Tax=Starmerella bombicola TaxID=75736 RepID=B8QHP6_STABO|nr:putative vesicle transport v-SNARE protein [Starmerella bombicola]
MSEYLVSHESDFQFIQSEIRDKLEALRENGANAGNFKSEVSKAEDSIEEALEILERMSAEVQGIPTSERSQFNTKIRGHRAEIDKAKRELRKLTDQQGKAQLFGGRETASGESAEYNDDASSQRQQLLSNQQRLERSSDRLRDAQRVGNETEAIGAGILTDLRGQREQITNSRNTLMEADSYVDKSLRTLRSMARRMAANRVISYAIIAILILLIIFVLASKFM